MANQPTPDGARDLLRIGELARRVNVQADTLRYYERRGLLEPTARSSSGYRLYAPDAVERVDFVRKAQTLGLTLGEVSDILQVALQGSPPCSQVRELLQTRIGEIDERISDLQALRRTLGQALDLAEVTDEEGVVCQIIESQQLPDDSGFRT